jgi:hypothetical protein
MGLGGGSWGGGGDGFEKKEKKSSDQQEQPPPPPAVGAPSAGRPDWRGVEEIEGNFTSTTAAVSGGGLQRVTFRVSWSPRGLLPWKG